MRTGRYLINKPIGNMLMQVRRLFRGAPPVPDLFMNIEIEEKFCAATLGKKTEGTGKKHAPDELKALVIRYMQDTGEEMTCTDINTSIRKAYQNAKIVRDDLRITITRMCEDGDLVPGKKTDNVCLAARCQVQGADVIRDAKL